MEPPVQLTPRLHKQGRPMKIKLKPLSEQRLLITGASSGIGLATARMAVKQGAQVVLVARSESSLRALQQELNRQSTRAVVAVADVAEEEQLRAAAEIAQREFGGLDSWINNAGISIYGEIVDITIDDMRKLFETNFWGVVYGSRIAVELLRLDGGAIINVGSVLSDVALPLQGIYSASKHAVKGFTDALRMELEAEFAPISVTLIKPAAIDTPYPQHARNYLKGKPRNLSPLYSPQAVAEAILCAAEVPTRDIIVGGAAKALNVASRQFPRVSDMMLEQIAPAQEQLDQQDTWHSRDALYEPSDDLRERGNSDGVVFERSSYTRAVTGTGAGAVATFALGALGAGLLIRGISSRRGEGLSSN